MPVVTDQSASTDPIAPEPDPVPVTPEPDPVPVVPDPDPTPPAPTPDPDPTPAEPDPTPPAPEPVTPILPEVEPTPVLPEVEPAPVLPTIEAVDDERAFLERSLADLDTELSAGDLTAADHAELTEQYLERLAALGGPPVPPRPETVPDGRSPRRWPARVLASLALMGIIATTGSFVLAGSGERGAGEPSSGDIRRSIGDQLVAARGAMDEGDFGTALEEYVEVVRRDNDNVEALTYTGWILVLQANQSGDEKTFASGQRLIDRAIKVDPDYPDARFFKGFALRSQGDLEGALAEFERYLASDVPGGRKEEVKALVESVKADLAASTTTTAPGAEP